MNAFPFTKMHGLGNDFIVIDNLAGEIKLTREEIKHLANRRTGVGFDQLLIVETASVDGAEFDYRIYNADGGEVEHCGNGARCFARFVIDRGLTESDAIKVNTANGVITLIPQADGQVTVSMGVPAFAPKDVPFIAAQQAPFYDLDVNGTVFKVGAASIGNPHVLIEVEDLACTDVPGLGSLIETHERFPNRVNVGFMQRHNDSHISLRVFERGVGETLACGTGACAAVAIAHTQGLLDKQATVTLSGGDLQIVWPSTKASIEMTGPCSTVFEGHTRM